MIAVSLVNTSAVTESGSRWLARYAKFVVLMIFFLIMVGGHTTTRGAGMAFPDWPLSHNSINPDGWWGDIMQRLEHGHRITAQFVALLIGGLCAWVWQSRWSLPASVVVSICCATAAKLAGAERMVVAHVGLWSSAATFALFILAGARRPDLKLSATVRWISFAAFLGVLSQAVMGGLRVTIESGGSPGLATAFRVSHGTFAHLELCLVVTVAAMLSPAWRRLSGVVGARGISILGWITAGSILLQLIVGASMRHLGAGLAIPTWPQANPDGGFLPVVHNLFVNLNFTHTRVGAAVVTLLVILLVLRVFGFATGSVALIRPAALLVGLVAVQFCLGVLVVWNLRPPIVTTLHVVNGAALLATTVLLALRAGRAGALNEQPLTQATSSAPHLVEEVVA